MKKIIDLTNATSILNQSDMIESNAIYLIYQDFSLSGNAIEIPEGCILSFEGGSIDNGRLTGNNTIIKDNQLDHFFKSSLNLEGSFSVKEVIANWFDELEDYRMFQKAFDFAYLIYKSKKTYYSGSAILVTCLSMSYYISAGMYIPVGVSFNGNNASFFPKNSTWNTTDFMFKLNIIRGQENWEIAYPGNVYEEFCHANLCNPDNILCHFILGGDSRYIHHINAFRPAIFYKQVDQYVDQKHFSDISISAENSSFPFDPFNIETYNIRWYLGDSCEMYNITGAKLYVSSGANASVRNAVYLTVYSYGCRNIYLENIHNELGVNENGGIIIVQSSSLTLRNAYFYAHKEGDIVITGSYNVGSELNLENVFFGNLLGLENFNTYYPIVNKNFFENSRVIINNVYGLINDGGNGHNFGNAILLKYKMSDSDSVHYINPNGEIINTEHVTNSHKYIDSNYVIPIKWQNGSGTHYAYIKTVYIVDENRHLELLGGLLEPKEEYIQSRDATQSYVATMYDSGYTIQQLTNLLIRILVGNRSGEYDHYYDFGLVMQNKENFVLTEKGVDGLAHRKEGSVILDYTPCEIYKCEGHNVFAKLLINQVPSKGKWICGDEVVLLNGEKYTFNGSYWN